MGLKAGQGRQEDAAASSPSLVPQFQPVLCRSVSAAAALAVMPVLLPAEPEAMRLTSVACSSSPLPLVEGGELHRGLKNKVRALLGQLGLLTECTGTVWRAGGGSGTGPWVELDLASLKTAIPFPRHPANISIIAGEMQNYL